MVLVEFVSVKYQKPLVAVVFEPTRLQITGGAKFVAAYNKFVVSAEMANAKEALPFAGFTLKERSWNWLLPAKTVNKA